MNELTFQEIALMDWGSLTPEFSRGNELIHVFNHDLMTAQAVARTIRFIISRIQWCNAYFKRDFVHTVIIDDVGQNLPNETYERILCALKGYAVNVRFSSKEA